MYATSTVFVVEGKTDYTLIKSLVSAYVVITDGLNVPRETITHLVALSKYHKIVIIADPDQNGKRISLKVKEALQNAVIVTIKKSDIVKKGKVGVAECDPKILFSLIKEQFDPPFVTSSDVTMNMLFDLGLHGSGSSILKARLISNLPLIKSGLRKLTAQLQMLNISIKEVRKALYE